MKLIVENKIYRLYSPSSNNTNYTIIDIKTGAEYLIDAVDVGVDADGLTFDELKTLELDLFYPYVWKIPNKHVLQEKMEKIEKSIEELIEDIYTMDNSSHIDGAIESIQKNFYKRLQIEQSILI